jgi:hypothetical protein
MQDLDEADIGLVGQQRVPDGHFPVHLTSPPKIDLQKEPEGLSPVSGLYV